MINESLRVLRKFWGLSQNELAHAIGVSQSYLSEVESGKKDVTMDLLQKYSDCLNVPMSSLLFFAETLEEHPPAGKGQVFVADKVLGLLKKMVPNDA